MSAKRRIKPATRIFSGDGSAEMWQQINTANSVRALRNALYVVCCRVQELEAKVERQRRRSFTRKAFYVPISRGPL